MPMIGDAPCPPTAGFARAGPGLMGLASRGLPTNTVSSATSLSVLFADLSESTFLSEAVGATLARHIISRCMQVMVEETRAHQGQVVRQVGDELMCTFPEAGQALDAALAMRRGVHAIVREDRASSHELTLSLRAAVHHGRTVTSEGEVSGEAVNRAAAISGLAEAGQLLVSREVLNAAPEKTKALRVRHVKTLTGRADSGGVEIHEVHAPARLELRYRDHALTVGQDDGNVIIGRGRSAHLIVDDHLASREHARIECRDGRFILTDQSRNGTFVTNVQGSFWVGTGEERELSGEGRITLGSEPENATEIVSYVAYS